MPQSATAGFRVVGTAPLPLEALFDGGRVTQWDDRVRLRLAGSHPGQPLRDQLAAYHRLSE